MFPYALAVCREPFDHPDWLYELKLAGFRALAVIESGACRLISRNAHVYKSFPGLCQSLAQLPYLAILDRAIVCLDRDGCPHFLRAFRFVFTLINQLQPELHDSRQIALRVHHTKLWVAETDIGRRKPRCVGNVEHLGTELQVQPLPETRILHDC